MDQNLIDRFEHPPREYGPVPLWWWSGATITPERIRWQLERFVDGGIHNLVLMNLAPKGPTYGAPPDDPPWFSQEWWELVAFTCDEAERLGVRLWFYDQIGFSGANIQGDIVAGHPEAAGQVLRSRSAVVDDHGNLDLDPREHLIGVYAERAGSNGWRRLRTEEGRVQAAKGTAVRVVSWQESPFDYLDPDACALLIDAVHGEFDRRLGERLGSVLVGSFQDELPAMPTWSSRFAKEFARRKGYDLLDYLPSLWERGGALDDAIRADYHHVRTALAEEAFFRPLGRWHERRGMLLGADQTNPARAGWPTQSSQLYGDYFTTHRWVNAVGSDHEGDARVHSSLADLYDHPRVWIESFHSSGWGGTLEETWDWLLPFFRSGADLYNPHATYFDTRAGWFEWAPPTTDFRQPYYALYPRFAAAVARTAALLTWGEHVVEAAVLYPATTGHAELAPDTPIDYFGAGEIGAGDARADTAQATYLELLGTNNWFRSSPGAFDKAGLDVDVIDEDSVHRADVQAGALHVSALRLHTLVLPSVTHLLPGTAERLVELLDAGGLVLVVGSAPEVVAGRDYSQAARDALDALVRHPRLRRVASAQEAAQVLTERAPAAWAPQGVRVRRSGQDIVAFLPAAAPNATAYPLRQDPDSLHWDEIDFDPSRYAGSTQVEVSGEVTYAEVWDPATGRRRQAPVRSGDGRTWIDVDFRGSPAAFVAWRIGAAGENGADVAAVPMPDEPDPKGVVQDAGAGWTHQIVATLDNTWGDFDLPAGRDASGLEIWRMQWRAGDSPAEPVRATFGQQVLVHGPAGEPPRALDPGQVAQVMADGALGGSSWQTCRFSTSRGADTDQGNRYEPKGFVPEEFLVHPAPDVGEFVTVRTIVRVPEPGEYDLTVAAPAAKRIWFDGIERHGNPECFAMTVPVTFSARTAVLEYQLGTSELPGTVHGDRPSRMASWFTFGNPGQGAERPEFIRPDQTVGGVGDLRTRFTLEQDAERMVVAIGSTSAVRLELDGMLLARQEKVSYYESDAVNRPMYFTHQLPGPAAGEHELVVVAETADPEHAVWVDALIEVDGDKRAVVSGPHWRSGSGQDAVHVARGLGTGLTHARAARRPHPLVDAQWLGGAPELGVDAVRFEASCSGVAKSQVFEVMLPCGTVEAELPALVERAELAGQPVEIEGGRVVLPAPLQRPAELIVHVAPRAFSVGGAVWQGPVRIRTAPFAGPFQDWRELGLGAWSGAVRSTCSVQVDEGERLVLELGRVRGAVRVAVDDAVVGEMFCGPFSADLGELSAGEHQVEVTVYGTLAPRLDSTSPTPHISPDQLSTGVLGPVHLVRRPAR